LSNVVIERCAIGDDVGSATLRLASFPHAGLNTLGETFAYAGIPTARLEQVDVVTLDGFFDTHPVERIDAIKIDVEGSELRVLAGATKILSRYRPVLIVELSSNALATCGASAERLITMISRSGYRLYRIGSAAELIPLTSDAALSDGNVVGMPIERAVASRSYGS
jgi:FkbM family methyltransferase